MFWTEKHVTQDHLFSSVVISFYHLCKSMWILSLDALCLSVTLMIHCIHYHSELVSDKEMKFPFSLNNEMTSQNCMIWRNDRRAKIVSEDQRKRRNQSKDLSPFYKQFILWKITETTSCKMIRKRRKQFQEIRKLSGTKTTVRDGDDSRNSGASSQNKRQTDLRRNWRWKNCRQDPHQESE